MAADPNKIGNLSNHHMSQLDKLVSSLVKVLLALWGDFGQARDQTFVNGVAAASARQVASATLAARKLNRSYQTQVLREMGVTKLDLPKLANPYPRYDVTPLEVYSRPAKEFTWQLHLGLSVDEAAAEAIDRLEHLAQTDLYTADRDEAHTVLSSVPQVIGWRRVIHPERAEKSHASCGLCVVAANQFYKTDELKPLHGDCHCDTVPAFGKDDPGFELNKDDLQAIYAAAGGTSAEQLVQTRIAVQENGELGPILVKKGDHFRTPEEVGRKPYEKPTAESLKESNQKYLRETNEKLAAAQKELDDLDGQYTLADQRAFDFDHLTPEQQRFIDRRAQITQAINSLQQYANALTTQLRSL
jgi:hypothetical protein